MIRRSQDPHSRRDEDRARAGHGDLEVAVIDGGTSSLSGVVRLQPAVDLLDAP